ncbi:cell cycle RNA binding protein whi3 [Diaporthe australafricana]|uniref:Cell cycle RNA binding protein whi3 n=1 Tax=Diaporthe australafricana TaxID=127596 RepID=A0ABR3W4G7_9PEZI
MTTYELNKIKQDRSRNIVTSVKSPGQTGSRAVYFLSGSEPHGFDDFCKKGVLSPTAGRMALGPTLELVDAYILTIADDSGIYDDDSGSWVVDCETLELYGHLVATDFLDEGIVVPMRDVFEDIKQHLAAVSVQLPKIPDILGARVSKSLGTMPAGLYDGIPEVVTSTLPESGAGPSTASSSPMPSAIEEHATRSTQGSFWHYAGGAGPR